MPSAAHWAAARRSMSAPRQQVGVLQHGVDGPPDGRAVAAPLPRRQVEVDGVLGQAGVGGRGPRRRRRDAGVGVGDRVVVGERRRPAGWRWSSSAPTPRRRPGPARRPTPRRRPTAARARRRRSASSGSAEPSSAAAPWPAAPPSASTVALVALAVPCSVDRSPACGAATRRGGRRRGCRRRTAAGGARRRPSARRAAGTPRTARCRCSASVHVAGRPDDRHRPACPGGWVVSPLTTVIGNSRPLAAWTVMIRTASWSRSGRIVSLARPSLAWYARPAQVPADAPPAGVGPRPGLVDDVAHPPPHVAGVGPGRAPSPAPGARRRCASSSSAGVDAADVARRSSATWAMAVGDRVVGQRVGRPRRTGSSVRRPRFQS